MNTNTEQEDAGGCQRYAPPLILIPTIALAAGRQEKLSAPRSPALHPPQISRSAGRPSAAGRTIWRKPFSTFRRAREILDFSALVPMPSVCIETAADRSSSSYSRNAVCNPGESWRTCFSTRARSSTAAQICSGFGRASTALRCSCSGRLSTSSSNEASERPFLLRRIIRAELMTMRVNQVENEDRP